MSEGKNNMERKIIIGSKNASIDDLRREAQETRRSVQSDTSEVVKAIKELGKELTGEGRIELPDGEERQRKFVREILETIEDSKRDCADTTNGQTVKKLETSLQYMEASVRDEVVVRLALHDSSELMRQAGGNVRAEGVLTISAAATEAQRRGHDITDKVALACFRAEEEGGGLPGLRISEAWDLLQDANFKYKDAIIEVNTKILIDKGLDNNSITQIFSLLHSELDGKFNSKGDRRDISDLEPDEKNNLKKLGLEEDLLKKLHSTWGNDFADDQEKSSDEIRTGDVAVNYHTDSRIQRKSAVKELLVKRMGGDVKSAKKSIQLAEKMAIASLETSVWNKSSKIGNDQLAECTGLQAWRKKRRGAGRPAGPLVHENAIKGFGTSWNRSLRPGDFKNPDELNKPQYAADVAIEKIGEGSWQGYCVADVGRSYDLKELLLDSEPQPDKINIALLKKTVPYFNTADKPDQKAGDKTGDKLLRVWWIVGIINLACTYPKLGWTITAINNLREEVVLTDLSEQSEGSRGELYGAGSFLTQKQWDQIAKATDYAHQLSSTQARGHVTDSVTNFFGGGGKKR